MNSKPEQITGTPMPHPIELTDEILLRGIEEIQERRPGGDK